MATTNISQETELQAELASLTLSMVLAERVGHILQEGKAHPGASKHHSRGTEGSQDSVWSGQKREWCFFVRPSSRGIISSNRLTSCVTALFSPASPLKSFPLNSVVLLLLPCTPTSAAQDTLECFLSICFQQTSNASQAGMSQNCSRISALQRALYALKSLPSTLGALPSQLAISCTLTPQSLTQPVGDWYLPFWTHFSSAIPKTTECFYSEESHS